MPKSPSNFQTDLIGLAQLSQDGIIGVVGLTEALQQRVYTLGGLLNSNNPNKTNGLTGFIYNTIRKTTAIGFKGIDLALATFTPLLPSRLTQAKNNQWRHQWLSILNGILGDHLEATQNPLAIDMTLTYQGQAITAQDVADICQKQKTEPLLLIHGLCMNDQQWLQSHNQTQHDHGLKLAENLPLTPIYLRYNSGKAVYKNGQELAKILCLMIDALPNNKSCHLLCHSMGGLVARSAMQAAEKNDTWIEGLGKTVFLGTPHHGAVLEKSAHLLEYVLSISAFSAPFTKLTGIRSQGIKDLRDGRTHQTQGFNPIKNHNNTYAIAGSTQDQAHALHQEVVGDGLVSVSSALGQHEIADMNLNILSDHQILIDDVNHMNLLSDPRVYKRLLFIYNT